MSVDLKGIDVSQHQGKIDWEKVKADGVKFAILRAGYGKNNIDQQFKRNIAECNRLGIPVGVYWFSYALSVDMAINEANYCLAAIKPYKVDFPVFFDFEYDSVDYAKRCGVTITANSACAMAIAFMQKVKASGYVAGWYANTDYIKRYLNNHVLEQFPLWIANYASKYSYSGKAPVVMWQYSSSGIVNGVPGNCDMNHGYKDYKQVVKPVPKTEKWYDKTGEWKEATKLKITDGTNPDQPATRAEVAAMILRAMKLGDTK